MQVDSDEELSALREQVTAAEVVAFDQADAACCYARSDKYWMTDPQGIPWETFHTLDSIPVYGDTVRAQTSACCAAAPTVETASSKSGACCA